MAADATSKLFEKLKAYKNFSNDSIFFKYIFDESDVQDANSKRPLEGDEDTFKPEFTHQIFGDDEIIFGYKNLHIDYYLTPGTLDAYIGVKSREKISPSRFDGIEPDDIYSSFKEFGCSPGFTNNIDTFCSDKLKKDLAFVPWGNKLCEYTREVEGKQSRFEIYKIDSSHSDYEDEKFKEYIDRVQTMLVFYIETSCFLDTEDPNWCHYLVYEKRKNQASVAGKQSNDYRYITIGYLSMYNYYAYPDKKRSRISQILILPKYQNAGHGAELTECVLRDVYQCPRTVDVTAESPSSEFIRLRDYVTTKMCTTLPAFKDKVELKKGFSSQMAKEALETFKIPKLQSRRCYEILRLACTNQHNNEEWTDYRLDLKKRFFKPFLNKSKYARNAGGSLPKTEEDDQTAASSTKSTKFEQIAEADEEEESEAGVTTIGFGTGGKSAAKSNTKPVKMVAFSSRMGGSTSQIGFGTKSSAEPESTTQIGFGSSGGSGSGSKSVSFAPVALAKEAEDKKDEDEDEGKSSDNLFISEKARKKYLEDQFQEAVEEYSKVIKRLEHANVLP